MWICRNFAEDIDLLFFVLENLQVQEKFKQVAGGEYIGFSNATWVICLFKSKIVLTVNFLFNYCCEISTFT